MVRIWDDAKMSQCVMSDNCTACQIASLIAKIRTADLIAKAQPDDIDMSGGYDEVKEK